MLVGGHETTGGWFSSWAWKLLAENPPIAAQLHEELDAVSWRAARRGGADVPKLAWSRAIFQEAMRLYPPVWYMARVANEADVVDGHPILRGSVQSWFLRMVYASARGVLATPRKNLIRRGFSSPPRCTDTPTFRLAAGGINAWGCTLRYWKER